MGDGGTQIVLLAHLEYLSAIFAHGSTPLLLVGGRYARDPGARLSCDRFVQLLREHKLFGEVTVPPPKGAVGSGKVALRIALDESAARAAFAAAASPESGRLSGFDTISFDEFVEALAGCAEVRYADVRQMNSAQRLEGTVHELLGAADVARVVAAANKANEPSRYAFMNCPRLPSENTSMRDAWLVLWPSIALSALPGFPRWDEPVHHLLHESWGELLSMMFCYAKQGGAGGDGGGGWRSIDETEWMTFIGDIEAGAAAAAAEQARQRELQADLESHAVDQVLTKEDPSDGALDLALRCFNLVTAALGKGKAKELGLVTFFQCIVTYAFVRFNPAHLPQLEAAAAADGGAAGGAEAAAEGRSRRRHRRPPTWCRCRARCARSFKSTACRTVSATRRSRSARR